MTGATGDPQFQQPQAVPPQYAPPPFPPPYAQAPYPPARPPGGGNGARLVAAGLLTLAAVLAVVGSVATFSTYRVQAGDSDPLVQTSTGWTYTDLRSSTDPGAVLPVAPPSGIVLVVAAVLAVVAVALLVRSGARRADPAPGRLLGVGAAGLLLGTVALLWIELLTRVRNTTALDAAYGDDSILTTEVSFTPGAGAYLVLVSALLGLAAAVVLLLPRAGRVGPPSPHHG